MEPWSIVTLDYRPFPEAPDISLRQGFPLQYPILGIGCFHHQPYSREGFGLIMSVCSRCSIYYVMMDGWSEPYWCCLLAVFLQRHVEQSSRLCQHVRYESIWWLVKIMAVDPVVSVGSVGGDLMPWKWGWHKYKLVRTQRSNRSRGSACSQKRWRHWIYTVTPPRVTVGNDIFVEDLGSLKDVIILVVFRALKEKKSFNFETLDSISPFSEPSWIPVNLVSIITKDVFFFHIEMPKRPFSLLKTQ